MMTAVPSRPSSGLMASAILITAILLSGCEKPGEKHTGKAPAAENLPQPTGSKSLPPASGKEPAADADARVQIAAARRNAIARKEDELASILARLGKALDRVRGAGALEAADIAGEEFKKLVAIQRELASEVLSGYAEFRKVLTAYRNELDRAPEAYRQAARYYRERSDAESNDLFKKNYALLAESSDAYAHLVFARKVELDRFLADAAETVAYVEKTAEFLRDYDEFLSLSPGAEAVNVRKKFRQELRAYAQAYSRFQDKAEVFGQRLKESAFSDRVAAGEVPPAEAEGEARKIYDEWRKELQKFTDDVDRANAEIERLRAARRDAEITTIVAGIEERRRRMRDVDYKAAPISPHEKLNAGLIHPAVRLKVGQVLPIVDRDWKYIGAAVVHKFHPDGWYELKPIAGRIAEQQRVLIKV